MRVACCVLRLASCVSESQVVRDSKNLQVIRDSKNFTKRLLDQLRLASWFGFEFQLLAFGFGFGSGFRFRFRLRIPIA